MRTFQDLTEQEWTLAITVSTIRDVRVKFDGLDLLDIGNPKSGVLERLFGDVIKFVDLLFYLVRDQAAELDISDEQFGRAMAGDVILDAQQAFVESLADFIPQQTRRDLLRKILAKARELETLMIRTNLDKLETMNLQALANEFTNGVGNSPESPDVIPFPGRSVS
ncbi:MAG: hypothetical protein ACE5KM_13805 [Planctomycetaceae bacterium]